MSNKALGKILMPSAAPLYTPRECISAIIHAHNGTLDDEDSLELERRCRICDALSERDYDYCIHHAGFSESTMREYEAFKVEFLATNWLESHYWVKY